MNITFTDQMEVTLTRVEGSDIDVARAAWVSTKGDRVEDESDPKRVEGLINYLIRDRHGSPTEHCGIQFLVSAPIFVWREHMRHRMMQYNEESGRYKVLEPKFYVPNADRPLIQTGKPGAYQFNAGDKKQFALVDSEMRMQCWYAYKAYENLLSANVAKEVARMCLPLNIYSTAYVRTNLRSLMNFLSLRVKSNDAKFKSFPQYEIDQLAQKYESLFEKNFPLVYKAFVANGRVAP